MRNIIYCRVSSLKPKSFSFIHQEEQCVHYCNMNKMGVKQIQKEHISGFGKQKGLEHIISKNKNINLIIYDISRFSRQQMFALTLLKKCTKNNINIHFVKENIKFKAKDSVISPKILKELQISEEEWHAIRNTTIKSITIRRKNGMVLGQVPFGFDKINKKLVKNNDFNVIRLIVGLRNGVKSNKEIKEILKTLTVNYETLKYYDEENNEISEFDNALTLSFKTITELLNDYDICNRRWIVSKVTNLYKKYCNDNEFVTETQIANIYDITI